MPKLKTNKAAKKRFKLTGTGKIRKTKMNKQHTPSMGKKTTKRKRHLRGLGVVDKSNEKQVKQMLPYM